MEERENEGISLVELLHVMFIKKWLLLGISLAVMIFGILFAQLVYNPSVETYKMEFQLDFPGYKDNYYPDGKNINFYDFISERNLEIAKSKSADYANINIEKMSNENGIVIVEETEVFNQDTIRSIKYNIAVGRKYFSSFTQAKNFLIDLVNVPIEYAIEKGKAIPYGRSLNQAKNADNYGSQINFLIQQRNLLLEESLALAENYTNAFSIEYNDEQLQISDFLVSLSGFFDRNNLELLLSSVSLEGYLKKDSALEMHILNDTKLLEQQKEDNLNQISLINSYIDEQFAKIKQTVDSSQIDVSLNTLQGFYETVNTLLAKNSEIDSKIKKNNIYIIHDSQYATKLEQFDAQITNIQTQMEELTKIFQLFMSESYVQNSAVNFTSSSKIVSNGGIGILIVAIVFLVIGFLIGCVLNLILDMPKYLKEKKDNLASLPTSSEPNAKELDKE